MGLIYDLIEMKAGVGDVYLGGMSDGKFLPDMSVWGLGPMFAMGLV